MRNILSSIFFLLIILSQLSCSQTPVEEEYCPIEEQGELEFKSLEKGNFQIITIDACEYLVFTENFDHAQHGYGFMAHKGNCKNPVHSYLPSDSSSMTLKSEVIPPLKESL